jgi:LPXTG-motif cell wall-anchored protein
VAALGSAPRVLGEQIRPAQPALARTGTDITSFAVLGILCLALGAAVRRRARQPAGG